MTGNTGLRRFTPTNGGRYPAPKGTDGNKPSVIERCEMCSTPLQDRHGHVVDTEKRTLACTCRACYLLFTAPGSGHNRFRAVPDRVLDDPEHPIDAQDWDALGIPVGTAFFFANSALGSVVGSYPSPAGATECELDLTEWSRLSLEYPLFRAPEADTEGIFLHRTGDGILAYLIPIDMCYAYVGEVRKVWRGLDGGHEVREVTATFLADLRARSRPLPSTDVDARPDLAES